MTNIRKTSKVDRILLLKHHRQPSDSLLRSTVDLARRCSARLTIADAVEGGSQSGEVFQGARQRELEMLLAPHVDGINIDYRLIDGDLAAAAAISDEFDLIFLADEAAATSETSLLLRRSSAPVWLQSSSVRSPRRLLAAVDVLTDDPRKRALNPPILEWALFLASVYSAELDVLSVWRPPASSLTLVRRITGKADDVTSQASEARQLLEESVETAMALCFPPGKVPRPLVETGEPAEVIARVANENDTDLLIAGCVGRDGLSGWLTGDTAEKLSRRLDRSILAIKPSPRMSDEKSASGPGQAA